MSFSFSETTAKLDKAIDHVMSELANLRTGKASPQLLDGVSVPAYGTYMKIHEVANVSAPDANMLIVSPWDKGLLEAVEKAVSAAQLNLNPVVDGDIIRIVVPALTEERRKEMVKLLYQRVETGKVMLRTVRTDAKKDIEAQKGTEDVSEDDIEQDLEELERIIKQYTQQLEDLAAKKEKELMTI